MRPIFRFREQTLKRCKVTLLDDKQTARFTPISLELFHFIYMVKKLEFPLFFRANDMVVEYIRPEELSKSLLDEMWEAMQRPYEGLEICVLRHDRPRFDALIEGIRKEKITGLKRKFPDLDSKALDLYANLSSASQMIVTGGIDSDVVARVRASAAYLVSNTIDSDAAISTLSRMIICDPTLYDHCATVTMIASMIALKIMTKPMSKREAEVLAQCALYHDVGKTCVPSAILNNPGKLTPEQFETMKQHTIFGHGEVMALINRGEPIDEVVARVALEHHEKWDGKGYPHGRKGALETDHEHGIHLHTRIVTVADIYSALLMKRVYKPAFEPQDAIRIMAGESAGFDPDVFVPFLKAVVSSLNTEQSRARTHGRILAFDAAGHLGEIPPPVPTKRSS